MEKQSEKGASRHLPKYKSRLAKWGALGDPTQDDEPNITKKDGKPSGGELLDVFPVPP